MRSTLTLGLAIAGLVMVVRSAEAADIGGADLIVRGYPALGVHDADWQAALHDVRRILAHAGIAVEWIDCSTTRQVAAPQRCTQPLLANEVAVRVVRGTTTSERIASLGESLLDPLRQSGTLATIYVDRTEWLAHSAGVRASTVLARAIAHELGHLLLGTSVHNREGLMRPTWTGPELRRGSTRDWQFTTADSLGMIAGLARRAQFGSLAPLGESRGPQAVAVGAFRQ